MAVQAETPQHRGHELYGGIKLIVKWYWTRDYGRGYNSRYGLRELRSEKVYLWAFVKGVAGADCGDELLRATLTPNRQALSHIFNDYGTSNFE